MRDDQADLVDVPEQQHGRPVGRADRGEARTEHVVVDARERLGLAAPDLGRGPFMRGWPVGAEQVVEEADAVGSEVGHGGDGIPDRRSLAADPR